MDSNNAAWSDGLTGGLSDFEQALGTRAPGEDWEDWLRWDPAIESTSPGDGTFNSGSSKNDSPLQHAALPLGGNDSFGKGFIDDTLAPPLVVGEDLLDFNRNLAANNNEPFVFGGSNTDFDFGTPAYPHTVPEVPKIDTSWPAALYAQPQNVTLSALSNEFTIPTASTLSSKTLSPGDGPYPATQPRASTSSKSSSDSPEAGPKKGGGRKRKIEVEEEERAMNGDSGDGDEPPVKKSSHNVIEKRYRNNLQDKIAELKEAVPSLRAMRRANCGEDAEDLEGLTAAHKLNKATVMGKATEYIKHLEKRNKNMADEMASLKARLAAVEAAIGKSRDRQASMSSSPPTTAARPRQPSSSAQNGAPSFLSLPQEQARYGQTVIPQQYMQQQPPPAYARPPNPPAAAQNQPQYVYGRGGGVMNKVMMGAMASIMVMEGFSEQQDSDAKQLFAVPTLLRRSFGTSPPSSPAAFARQAGVPLLKLVCVIGAVLYFVVPLLAWKPRRKQRTRPAVRLPQVPSLASPVEVRRKAWLTAMQTVYVPKHFLLEVVAVAWKMFSLSLRRLVGTEAWNSITGTKEEEEAARVKAWDIAIDAQLAGGDAEVSYYRLLLTLMASGTLPDSPTRLMQKAVHFRVFFWEVANAGYGNMVGFKTFTEKVGKIYWDSARKLQKELLDAQAQGRPSHDDGIEVLPDHLASLVKLECDDVLSDEMIQRAWNLAWDKPSAYNTTANVARDSVIEDHAIRSPLDAVAAWYANLTIDDTLLDMLSEHPSSLDTEYYLGLAASVAPPASATQMRALAAKAVLSNSHRDANIIAALETFPVTSPGSDGMNLVCHAPAAADVHVALTLAKLLSLLASNTSSTAHVRAYSTIASMHIPADSFTLLTAVATYRLLRVTSNDRHLPYAAAQGLEDFAANLRLWVGTSEGYRAGLSPADSGRVVELCLGMAKKVGGWNGRDSGYTSLAASPIRAFAEVGAF
ncbi:hypothetical protein BAUCODRAFT_31094 [Baudoinia panamericana UAMH 10762]|uniref:BHLH domain-containing protein n=1 Tax=Baudoinia panamericana (strain UAMH 10762) TaxID=717646 RepID=M2NIB2_BAUPA|nr:uncharacterized protein BAUCODRAFT_31094 [Baudoinia panamericana UAMH 10762]EMC98830.1 hypothetical protein BAUCODRAFT_31094 [Baudoinia panamericana UAMH 10762]